MTIPARCRASAAFLCLAAGAVRAQPNPVIQTETRVVLVDAVVTAKNGEYVRDLTVKDFRVWQDNQEQTLKSFALETASAVSQPRSLVLFFDETSMESQDQILARQAASRFIDAETGPNHRMAVVDYNGSLRVAQNFTDNAGRLKEALPSPEFNVTHETRSSARSSTGASGNSAAADFGARNLVRSVAQLGQSLGVLPGRKIVVVFTGQVPASADQRFEMKEALEACNRSDVAIYPVDVRPVSDQAEPDVAVASLPSDRRAVPRRSRGPQGDSEDSAPLAQALGASSQQLLSGLASGTGGFVIRNSSDLLGGLQRIAEEQNQYYVLTYSPPESKEGSCHALRVKVDRRGATVRARTRYCVSKPQDLLAGTSAAQDLERRAASAQPGNTPASVELAYFYIAPNVARVHVAMEIASDTLKFESQKGKPPSEIDLLGIAAAPDGAVRARFSDAVKLDAGSPAPGRRGFLHYQKEFKIAPGPYTFTMAFSQGGASFGKIELPLTVDPWTGGELGLSGLVLSKETHPAADLGLGALMEDRTPLIADGVQLVPSGSHLFTKADEAVFYFEAYDSDPSSVRVQVRVLDRKTGEPRWDSGITKLGLPANPGKASIPAAARLPLNTLATGSYQLQITASDAAGKPVIRTADFDLQ
ncbi:MAG: VWA domain-containing protein [Acidobacteriia bacterium]|nr:VWA domain-containing protein [Terriglobia bacterium]